MSDDMRGLDDMKGLFFVVKGQYQKDNSADGVCVSGYDPYAPTTPEWYMVMDNTVYYCIACGSDLNRVLSQVKKVIMKYKTRRNYFKRVCELTSEDYYETHYLGQRPLTPEERTKKMEGRCPRVSPSMKTLYGKIFDEYGDFYDSKVREQENSAYEALAENTPFKRSKRLVNKTKTLETPSVSEEKTPKKLVKKKTQEDTPVTLKVKPKVKLGVKRRTLPV